MSFQAYIDNIRAKTGKTPVQLKTLATKAGVYRADMKAGELVAWLKEAFDLGHGHSMAIWAVFKSEDWVESPEGEEVSDRNLIETTMPNKECSAMTHTSNAVPASDRELVLTKLINAPRESVYRAWTEPGLLKQWFAPLPWTTPVAETDVRPGGSNLIVMRGPDGKDYPNRGVYLEVVTNERLVFTDAYTSAWEPSEKPFMTVTVTLESEGDATRYTARVLHWTVADREAHEKMGFHDGWRQCADQLAAVVARL